MKMSDIFSVDKGLTLLEILLSLVILGIIAGIVLQFFVSQYRFVDNVAAGSELNYSLLRAGEVLTSTVNVSEKVVWRDNTLIVTYKMTQNKYTDSYYLADKDFDGKLDLYREHLGVPNPIASGMINFNCREVSPGLWAIKLEACYGEQNAEWERYVRQKCQRSGQSS
ncbi:MAG: prepilin-type N-terminal cleavage/methylation domain-containing protein [Peptococcaceae bacterium]|nr:prepilin-type N-terminal cleavage/methylation domain-containing protein [Peptococcaceae bacterium]